MNVLFIFHDSNFYSGGTRSMYDVLAKLAKRDENRLTAMLPERSEDTISSRLERLGVAVIFCDYYNISYERNEGLFRHAAYFPIRIWNLYKTIINTEREAAKLEALDVVYSNTSVIINGVIFKRRNSRIKHIWHIREFCEEDHKLNIIFGRRLYYRLLNKYTDDVIYISDALKEKYTPFINRPETYMIYDDVSPEYYQKIIREYKAGTQMRILMAGMISEGKGQLQALQGILEAKKLGCDVKVFFAGRQVDKKYMKRIETFIKDNGMEDNVSFLGLVKDMNSLRNQVDFGLVASSSEAFGRITIEGMLSGLCMIGADAAGTSELIADGKTGRLYKYGDSVSLGRILSELSRNEDNIVNEMKARGQAYAIIFTKGKCAERIQDIIDSRR
ncbi:glycosyltransferase [Clostridiaceae bacterium]|nr:glycosyltransferase [Clostridiaceae bacterium]